MQESASLSSTETELDYAATNQEDLLSMAVDGRDVVLTVVADEEPQAPPGSPFVLSSFTQTGPAWTFRLETAPEVLEPGPYELTWVRGAGTYSLRAAYGSNGGVILYPKPEGPK
jgi:hypothetical protein